MRIFCQPQCMAIQPRQQEEDTHYQCKSRGRTHHSRRINESVTQNPSGWFQGREGMDPSTKTSERELGAIFLASVDLNNSSRSFFSLVVNI